MEKVWTLIQNLTKKCSNFEFWLDKFNSAKKLDSFIYQEKLP